MSEQNQSTQQKRSIWYTYFGEGGAGVFAFLMVLLLLAWVFGVLKWG